MRSRRAWCAGSVGADIFMWCTRAGGEKVSLESVRAGIVGILL